MTENKSTFTDRMYTSMYYCEYCNHSHRVKSKIGTKHFKRWLND